MILDAIMYYLTYNICSMYRYTYIESELADIALLLERRKFEFSTVIADLILCLALHLQCFEYYILWIHPSMRHKLLYVCNVHQ